MLAPAEVRTATRVLYDVAVNTIGSLVAGLILLLAGIALGAINGVPTATTVVAGALLVVNVLAWSGLAVLRRRQTRARRLAASAKDLTDMAAAVRGDPAKLAEVRAAAEAQVHLAEDEGRTRDAVALARAVGYVEATEKISAVVSLSGGDPSDGAVTP